MSRKLLKQLIKIVANDCWSVVFVWLWWDFSAWSQFSKAPVVITFFNQQVKWGFPCGKEVWMITFTLQLTTVVPLNPPLALNWPRCWGVSTFLPPNCGAAFSSIVVGEEVWCHDQTHSLTVRLFLLHMEVFWKRQALFMSTTHAFMFRQRRQVYRRFWGSDQQLVFFMSPRAGFPKCCHVTVAQLDAR